MAFFNTTRGALPKLRQAVLVNGGYDPTIWCNSVGLACGLDPLSASFQCPRLVWESNLAGYREAFIILSVGTDESGFINLFTGYIDTDSASVTPDSNTVTFGAKSTALLLKKVRFGHSDGVPTRTYQLIDPVTGKKTGVTVKSLIQSLWSKMDGAYKQRIKLGNVSALGGSPNVPDPEITLRSCNYQAATEQLLCFYGNVVPIQRFEGYVTYIDFIRLNDPSNPINSVRVAALGEKVTDGANVAQITKATQSTDVTTKFRAYGTGRRYGITLASYDSDAAKKLQGNWDEELEERVLACPNTSDPNSAIGSLPGADKVFKEFQLPRLLHGLKKLKDLPIVNVSDDGVSRPVPCTAFMFTKILVDDPSDDNKLVGVAVTTPVPIKGVKWDLDKNLIVFAQPCVRPKSRYLGDNGQIVTEYEAAPVEVTIGIEDTEHYVYGEADGTAAAGLKYDFASAGLQDDCIFDNLPSGQLTNVGFPIGGKQWPCRIYNEFTKTVQYYTSALNTTPTVQQSLQRIAQEQLSNSCRRAISLTIEIPWFAPGYRVGNRLVLQGNAGYDWDVFTITGISYDFSDGGQATTLTVDNSRPKKTSAVSTRQAPNAIGDVSGYEDQSGYDDTESDSEPDDESDQDSESESDNADEGDSE